MNKKITLYFFGDTGTYDEFSPTYVCNKSFAPEILYLIAHNVPFSISKNEIIHQLNINEKDFNDIISSLKLIKAIDEKENTYKLNFTVFLEEDLPLLDEYFLPIGEIIGKNIIENRKLIYDKLSKLSNCSSFSKERLLYHVVCDKIFDGTAFDFFSEKNIFSPSKIQPGNRDYIIFGYEDSEKIQAHSNALLCSSNNYRLGNFTFNSFGDSKGTRKDMFRFFRKIQDSLVSATPFTDLNLAYIKIIEDKNIELAKNCGELIWRVYNNKITYTGLSSIEKDLVNFLKELGYLNINVENNLIACIVPIFQAIDIPIIKEVSDIILNSICNIVKNTFENFEKNALNITPIRHEINIKEIAIELWHQIFGFTNEYLCKVDFVQAPIDIAEEGRYLRSFWK